VTICSDTRANAGCRLNSCDKPRAVVRVGVRLPNRVGVVGRSGFDRLGIARQIAFRFRTIPHSSVLFPESNSHSLCRFSGSLSLHFFSSGKSSISRVWRCRTHRTEMTEISGVCREWEPLSVAAAGKVCSEWRKNQSNVLINVLSDKIGNLLLESSAERKGITVKNGWKARKLGERCEKESQTRRKSVKNNEKTRETPR
jgi:hypothetical protein